MKNDLQHDKFENYKFGKFYPIFIPPNFTLVSNEIPDLFEE